jgi:hypothetical protein
MCPPGERWAASGEREITLAVRGRSPLLMLSPWSNNSVFQWMGEKEIGAMFGTKK